MDVIKIIMHIDQDSPGARGCIVPSAITILVENNLTGGIIVHFSLPCTQITKSSSTGDLAR
jgi:hypothetical protein